MQPCGVICSQVLKWAVLRCHATTYAVDLPSASHLSFAQDAPVESALSASCLRDTPSARGYPAYTARCKIRLMRRQLLLVLP